MAEDRGQHEAGGEVVEFLSTRDRPAERSLLRELEEHWRELRGVSGSLPRRADLDAGRIAGALPHAFILERVAPGVARLRIAGRSIVGLLGGEARGLPLSLLFTPAARPALQGWVETCFDAPAVVELPLTSSQGPFRAALTGRLLLLPMLDAEGEVARALGGLLTDTVPKRGPVRFDLGPSPLRCLPAMQESVHAREERSTGLREAERPWLRLVVSNG